MVLSWPLLPAAWCTDRARRARRTIRPQACRFFCLLGQKSRRLPQPSAIMTRRQPTSSSLPSRAVGVVHGPQGAAAIRASIRPAQLYSMSHMPSGRFQVIENSPMQCSGPVVGPKISGSPGGFHTAGIADVAGRRGGYRSCCHSGLRHPFRPSVADTAGEEPPSPPDRRRFRSAPAPDRARRPGSGRPRR